MFTNYEVQQLKIVGYRKINAKTYKKETGNTVCVISCIKEHFKIVSHNNTDHSEKVFFQSFFESALKISEQQF